MFGFVMEIEGKFMKELFDFVKGREGEEGVGGEGGCGEGWMRGKGMKGGIGFRRVLGGMRGVWVV